MIESQLPTTPRDPNDLGPPVLLKRLGNAVEANLAKNKLASAGIPSFLGGENVFAGDMVHPLPFRDVELYVPETLVHDALDVLDAPVVDEIDFEPFTEDPARGLAFRAFVAAVIGWLLFFLAPIGFLLDVPAFGYALYLAWASLHTATERTNGILAQCILAIFLSVVGLLTVLAVTVEMIA